MIYNLCKNQTLYLEQIHTLKGGNCCRQFHLMTVIFIQSPCMMFACELQFQNHLSFTQHGLDVGISFLAPSDREVWVFWAGGLSALPFIPNKLPLAALFYKPFFENKRLSLGRIWPETEISWSISHFKVWLSVF